MEGGLNMSTPPEDAPVARSSWRRALLWGPPILALVVLTGFVIWRLGRGQAPAPAANAPSGSLLDAGAEILASFLAFPGVSSIYQAWWKGLSPEQRQVDGLFFLLLLFVAPVALFMIARRIAATFAPVEIMKSVDAVTTTAARQDWSSAAAGLQSAWLDLNRHGKVAIAQLATILLTMASWYTTWNGIAYFTNNALVALLASLGIQITLYIGAWIVAESLAKRHHLRQLRRKLGDDWDEDSAEAQAHRVATAETPFWAFALFLGAFWVSVFFSYDALFDVVYTEDQRALNNILIARSEIGKSFSSIKYKMADMRERELKGLGASKEWEGFDKNLKLIAEIANSSRDAIQKAFLADRSKIEKELKEANDALQREVEVVNGLQAKIDVAATSPDAAQQFANDAGGQVEQLKRRQSDLQAEIADLERQRVEKKQALDVEEKAGGRGLGTRRKQGRGPVWRTLNADYTEIMAKLSVAKSDLKSVESDLARAKSALEQALASGKSLAEKLAIEKQNLEAARARVAEVQGRYQLLTGQSAEAAQQVNNVAAASFGLDGYKSGFLGSGSRAAYNALTERCGAILKVLENTPGTKEKVAGVNCSTSAFDPKAKRIQELDEALVGFAKECVVDDAFNRMNVVQLVSKGRYCAGLSTLQSTEIGDERNLIDKVEAENSEKTSHFVRDLATLRRGDYQSWLALAIAFFIDFLVFAAAMLGSRAQASQLVRDSVLSPEDAEALRISEHLDLHIYPDDPKEIRNQKILLALHGDGDSPLDVARAKKEYRDEVSALIALYKRRKLIREEDGKFVFDASLISYLTHNIGSHERSWSVRRKGAVRDKTTGTPPLAGGDAGREEQEGDPMRLAREVDMHVYPDDAPDIRSQKVLLALFGEGGKVDLSRVRPEFHNDVNFWLKTWRLFSPKGQGGGEADMISDEMARNMVIAVGQHELTLRRKRGGQQRDRAQGVDPLLKEDTPQQPPRPWEKQKPRRRFGVLQADE